MPARGLAGSSLLLLLVGSLLFGSCSVYLDDLTTGGTDAGPREEAGPGAAGAGNFDAAGTTGRAGGAGSGGIGGSTGSGGADLDANGVGGTGGKAGAAGFSGMGTAGAGGTMGGTGPDATGGAAGMDASGGAGGTAGSGGQSGSAGSGPAGAAGTSGAGGTEAGTDAITVLDTGANDAPRDVPASDDAGGVCQGAVCKRVFVSSQPAPSGANLGGLTGADAFCQSVANTHQLGGTWKAWLSDPTTSASARLAHAAVPYVLLDGSTVAADWSALTSGTLAHTINLSEDGTVHTAILEVWTATTSAGTYSGRSCSAWTSNAPGSTTADVGLSSQTNGDWTNRFQQYCDRTNVHLYCIEQ
jgi:hypothetical protein